MIKGNIWNVSMLPRETIISHLKKYVRGSGDVGIFSESSMLIWIMLNAAFKD